MITDIEFIDQCYNLLDFAKVFAAHAGIELPTHAEPEQPDEPEQPNEFDMRTWLLQQDQNLSDNIATCERNFKIVDAQCSKLRTELQRTNAKRTNLLKKLKQLKAEREVVHQQWVSLPNG